MKTIKYSFFVVGALFLVVVTGCGGGGVKPPTAVITSPQSGAQVMVNQVVEFQGAAKDDAGKEVTKDIVYEWDFGDGATGTGQSASHAYNNGGTYTVKLTVKTAAQAKETSPKLEAKQTAQIDIVVTAALSVAISASVTEGPAPLEVSFTAEVQGGGTAASYTWDFGDGATSTEANPTHMFTTEGTYTIRLVVTGSDGSTASAEKTITVTASGGVSQGTVHIVKMVTTQDGRNFFDPAELTITVGDTVRWVNECEEGVACVHSAQAYPDKIPAGAEVFDSTLLTGQGLTYEYTFTVPGEYEYFCLPHEALGMKGKIIVNP